MSVFRREHKHKFKGGILVQYHKEEPPKILSRCKCGEERLELAIIPRGHYLNPIGAGKR